MSFCYNEFLDNESQNSIFNAESDLQQRRARIVQRSEPAGFHTAPLRMGSLLGACIHFQMISITTIGEWCDQEFSGFRVQQQQICGGWCHL